MFLNRSSTRTGALVGALALSLTLGACGKDSTGPGDTSLDTDLSFELLSYLFFVGFNYIEDPDVNAQGAFDATGACQNGGNIRLQGTFTDNTNAQGTGPVSIQMTYTPNACRVSTAQRGVYVLNGNPNIGLSWSANYINFQPTGDLTFQYTGGFGWSGEGRSGSCAMNVTWKLNWQTQANSVTGSMCGNNLNHSG